MVDNPEDVTRNNIPRGIIWEGFWSEDTHAGKFLKGVGTEFNRYINHLDDIVKGFDFLQSTSMLDRLEEFLGIPDARLNMQGASSPLTERQKDVFAKLFLLRDNSLIGLQKIATHYGSSLKVIPDPDPNKIVVELSASQTANLAYDHDYDRKFDTSGSGIRKTIAILNYIKPAHTTVEERIV